MIEFTVRIQSVNSATKTDKLCEISVSKEFVRYLCAIGGHTNCPELFPLRPELTREADVFGPKFINYFLSFRLFECSVSDLQTGKGCNKVELNR